jgi:outer membrane protein assembly factor BamB
MHARDLARPGAVVIVFGCGVVGVRNLFRLRIDSPDAFQDQLFTFIDAGERDTETRLAVQVEWRDRAVKHLLEPVFIELTRRHMESSDWISPGTLLEDVLHSVEAALRRVPSGQHDSFDVAVALSTGRSLYLLYTQAHQPWFSAGGAPMPLQSTLRLRVKDLLDDPLEASPGETRTARLRLVRVFCEDEDRVVLWLPHRGGVPDDVSGFRDERAIAPQSARIVVVKEVAPGVEAMQPVESQWPDADAAPRRDRVLISYAAVGLVVVVFATALIGMWRWNRIGDAGAAGDALVAEDLVGADLASESEPPARVARDVVEPETAAEPDVGTTVQGDPAADAAITPAAATPDEAEEIEQPLQVVWSRRYSDWVTSSPRVVQGRVVYGCRDGNLYAVDPDGAPLWQYNSGAGIGASPEVDGARLFCGNYAGRAFALRVLDGMEIWARELGTRVVASAGAGKKHVFFATYAGEIVALEKKTGKVAWKHTIGGEPRSRPLPVRDDVVVISDTGEAFCLSQDDGTLRWQATVGAGVISDPLRVGDLIVFGSKDGHVNAMSIDDGTFAWRTRAAGAVNSSPATNDDHKIVFVGASDRHVYAFRANDGARLWSFRTQSPVLSQPWVEGDKVYVTSYDHKSYALASETGALIAEVALKAPIYSSPLVHDGHVYFGSNDGTFYCVTAAR